MVKPKRYYPKVLRQNLSLRPIRIESERKDFADR
jgi:hypothetical protein